MFYHEDRMLFSISILRIEIVCAEFYLQDGTYSILRIEILSYALLRTTTEVQNMSLVGFNGGY